MIADPDGRRATTARSMTAFEGKGECRAHLTHTLSRELRNPAAQAIPGDRHHVVQVDGARLLHPILDTQGHLRRNATDRRGDRGHRDSGEIAEGGPAGQDEDRPLLVGRRGPVEANLASL